mmetsp:Transcript_26453/g.99497  ORF Transcript_26453/g.99497 Transcript_26453/m.99497 type:complete len:201 (+) Transcript_26453:3024-3626(+)
MTGPMAMYSSTKMRRSCDSSLMASRMATTCSFRRRRITSTSRMSSSSVMPNRRFRSLLLLITLSATTSFVSVFLASLTVPKLPCPSLRSTRNSLIICCRSPVRRSCMVLTTLKSRRCCSTKRSCAVRSEALTSDRFVRFRFVSATRDSMTPVKAVRSGGANASKSRLHITRQRTGPPRATTDATRFCRFSTESSPKWWPG